MSGNAFVRTGMSRSGVLAPRVVPTRSWITTPRDCDAGGDGECRGRGCDDHEHPPRRAGMRDDGRWGFRGSAEACGYRYRSRGGYCSAREVIRCDRAGRQTGCHGKAGPVHVVTPALLSPAQVQRARWARADRFMIFPFDTRVDAAGVGPRCAGRAHLPGAGSGCPPSRSPTGLVGDLDVPRGESAAGRREAARVWRVPGPVRQGWR